MGLPRSFSESAERDAQVKYESLCSLVYREVYQVGLAHGWLLNPYWKNELIRIDSCLMFAVEGKREEVVEDNLM